MVCALTVFLQLTEQHNTFLWPGIKQSQKKRLALKCCHEVNALRAGGGVRPESRTLSTADVYVHESQNKNGGNTKHVVGWNHNVCCGCCEGFWVNWEQSVFQPTLWLHTAWRHFRGKKLIYTLVQTETNKTDIKTLWCQSCDFYRLARRQGETLTG